MNYANGKTPSLNVYVPVSKLPKGLLPKNLSSTPEQMPINSFFANFGIPITANQIQWISLIGKVSYYMFLASIGVAALCLFLLILLVGSGQRFVFPGIVMGTTGVIIIFFWNSARNFSSSLNTNLQGIPTVGQDIIRIVAPPLVTALLERWVIVGSGLIILAIVFFFLKKPSRGK